jgi:hypothetical protein
MCRRYLAIVKADAQNAHARASPVDNWLWVVFAILRNLCNFCPGYRLYRKVWYNKLNSTSHARQSSKVRTTDVGVRQPHKVQVRNSQRTPAGHLFLSAIPDETQYKGKGSDHNRWLFLHKIEK